MNKRVKILGSLVSIGAIVTPVITTVSASGISKRSVVESLNIKLDSPLSWTETTNSTGDDSRDHTTDPYSEVILGYDIADFGSNDRFNKITVNGSFDFHTYLSEKQFSHLDIWKDYKNSTDSHVVFTGEFQHRASSGWGHQTSTMAIRVIISPTHIGAASAVILSATLRTYAGTSGSVHSATTSGNIDGLSFLKNPDHTVETPKTLISEI